MERVKIAKGDEFLQWMRWGDRDYLASRQLLIAGLLVQGISFATTAIEKYLKAIAALLEVQVPRSHNPLDLYRRLKSRVSFQLDEEFLGLIAKAYQLRYPDDLPRGFNIALNQALILTRLDKSVYLLIGSLNISNESGDIQLLLARAVKDNDRGVLDGNVVFDPSIEDHLYASPSKCLDFHKIQNGAVLEADYTTARVNPSESLIKVAMAQLSDRSFQLAYQPFEQVKSDTTS